MSPPKGKPGKPRRSKTDDEALRGAYAGVKPLRKSDRKRAAAPPPERPAPSKTMRARNAHTETLRVEREGNGIVTGKRARTHSSILDTLEDPKLEVEAAYDLHGLKAHEAEREVLLFVRKQQKAGNRWVLLIVGKGLHSPGGRGTLRDHVIRALAERAPSRFVLAFRTAPRHLGGTGALAIRLVDRV